MRAHRVVTERFWLGIELRDDAWLSTIPEARLNAGPFRLLDTVRVRLRSERLWNAYLFKRCAYSALEKFRCCQSESRVSAGK